MSEAIISKCCTKCKKKKPVFEFHKDRSTKDGLLRWCKSCQKAYCQTDKGKAVNHKATAKYLKTPKGKATMKRFYTRNPNYAKATNAVNHAIRDGKLPRPDSLLCHYCPKPAKQYHHWKGYEPEHWLDVLPVCRDCHKELHKKIA